MSCEQPMSHAIVDTCAFGQACVVDSGWEVLPDQLSCPTKKRTPISLPPRRLLPRAPTPVRRIVLQDVGIQAASLIQSLYAGERRFRQCVQPLPLSTIRYLNYWSVSHPSPTMAPVRPCLSHHTPHEHTVIPVAREACVRKAHTRNKSRKRLTFRVRLTLSRNSNKAEHIEFCKRPWENRKDMLGTMCQE